MFELVDETVPIQRIATGFTFTEGPVWDRRDNRLIFVDFRADSVFEWRQGSETTLLRHPSSANNGNTFDRAGRLHSCLAEAGQIVRTESDGSWTVLVSEYEGQPLNAPNDLVFGPDGSLYFTDTPYLPAGRMERPRGVPGYGVYRLAGDGGLDRLALLEPPNGIVVSTDGRRLYVSETSHHAIHVWDLASEGKAKNQRLFADTRAREPAGRPDGMKMDVLGNLYVAANVEPGIWVYNPEGELLGFIDLPEAPANCAWGDGDWRTLYVTAQTSVYRVRMKVAGQPVGAV